MNISYRELQAIVKQARQSYPQECCGVLVGRRKPKLWVTRSVRAENLNLDHATDSYEIAPEELQKVDKSLGGTDEEIVGFYHSHPDQPPLPSLLDKERAQADHCYLIITVNAEKEVEGRAWVMNDGHWEEVPIEYEIIGFAADKADG
jgi:proteasome lid subunit RPN8/RPN11